MAPVASFQGKQILIIALQMYLCLQISWWCSVLRPQFSDGSKKKNSLIFRMISFFLDVRMKVMTFKLSTHQSDAGSLLEDFKHRSDVICFMVLKDCSRRCLSLEDLKRKQPEPRQVSDILDFLNKHLLNCNPTLTKINRRRACNRHFNSI